MDLNSTWGRFMSKSRQPSHDVPKHGHQKQEQEPFDVVQDCLDCVNEGVLGGLQHPAMQIPCCKLQQTRSSSKSVFRYMA